MNPPAIVVADDSRIVAAMLSQALTNAGYQVANAADGIEAVQMVYSTAPDLLLLDIYMPRMNGYEVCRLIRNEPDLCHLPVAIMTGSGQRGDEQFSFQTGADAFLQKSEMAAELVLETVARLLEAAATAPPRLPRPAPTPEEILSKVSAVMDQELLKFGALFDSSNDAIVLLQEERIFDCNRRTLELFGVDAKAALIGGTLGDRSPAEQPDGQASTLALRVHLGEALTGATPRFEWQFANAAGSALPAEVVVAPFDYGARQALQVTIRDITERKQVERLREDLTAMMVHDLRTPLTSLLTGLLTFRSTGEQDELEAELLEGSIAGGRQLLAMVNDLLDIAKLEAGSLHLDLEPCRPTDLVDEAMRQLSALINGEAPQVTTEVEEGLQALCADREMLCRILVNLVGNAIKFTPLNGEVRVAARAGDEGDTLFSVSDTGEGIPAQDLCRVFDKFGQVESRQAGRRMSTGLGLTFCKLAVEAHHGRIWVESQLGLGSTFWFALPPNEDRPSTAPACPAPRAA